jgi:hypothetical protein
MNALDDEAQGDELRTMISKVAAATLRLTYVVGKLARPQDEEERRELATELRHIQATLLQVVPKKRRRGPTEGF